MHNHSALKLFISFVFVLTKTFLFSQCNADAGPNITMCVGEAEILGDSPSASGNSPFTYSWSPAAGLSCTNCPNPICTATTSTTYTLTITDDNGCTDSDNVNVSVAPDPTAGFTFSPNNGCSTIPIQFTSTSTGVGLNYSWNFGDPGPGNNSSQTNPTHDFDSNGSGSQSYNVQLIVTSSAGCKDTVIQTVTVAQSPGAMLMDPINSFKNCDGSNFNMTVYDASTSPGTSYTIIWGDGSPNYSAATFPGSGVNHLYSTSDIFDLYYIVSGANGCADTMHQLVSNITNPAIGAANPGATTGCGPMTLCFPLSNYSSNHSSTYYIVDYGDNSPVDTLPHPPPAVICHTYTQSSCGQPGNAYTFKMKAINSCDSSLASISPIRVYSGPIADFNPVPTVACVGAPITFMNSSILGFNSTCSNTTLFNWNFGDGQTLTSLSLTNPVHSYAAPGTYTVTLSTQNACGTTTHSETVCIESPPIPSFTLTPDTACVPFTTQATNLSSVANTCAVTRNWTVIFNGSTCAPSSGTWNFINGTNATSVSPEFQFIGAGQYTVRLTMTNSCGTFIYDQYVLGQAPPQISLPGLPTICAGESVAPTATINNCYESVDAYTWTLTGGIPSSSVVLSPGNVQYATSGAYSIQLQVTNQCGTVNASTPLTVVSPPLANAGTDVLFCSGGNGSLGAAPVGGVSYSWSPTPGLSSSSVANPTVTLTNGTTVPTNNAYVLTASTSATCLTRDTVLVTVNPIPALSVNSPTICIGQTANLLVSGAGIGGNYTWNASPTLSCLNCDNPIANPLTTTNYTVVGTNVYSCTSSVISTVTVNPLPIVNAGPDQTLCDQPIAVTLNGTPAGGTWTGSTNVSSGGIFTPNGPENSTLYYTYINPSTTCQNLDSIIVIVNPPIIPTIDPIDSLCFNSSNSDLITLLNANPTTGTFSGTGVTGSTFNATTAGVGIHQVVYNLGTGTCSSADTSYITVNPQPTINVNNATICVNDTTSLLATGAGISGSYSWSPVTGLSCANCANPFSYPISTTVYAVTGTNSFGCSTTVNSTVTVNPLPVVSAGSDLFLCDQPVPVTLNGSPIGGTWTGSPNVTSGGIFTPNGSEIANLVYTLSDPITGCEDADTMIVTVSPAIIPTVDPNYSICENGGIVNLNTSLNPNPIGGNWSGTGVTTPNFNPSTAGVGTHTVTYIFGTGTCQTSVNSSITVNPTPSISVNSETICNGQSIQLIVAGAGLGGTYNWSPATALSCANCFDPIANPTTTITYTVQGTTTLGCSNSANSTVTVNALPLVSAGPDLLLCDQPIPTTLNGSPVGGTWSGSPNVTAGGIFTPNGTETSTLYYTYVNIITGCQNVDSMVVTVNPPITPTIDPTHSMCIYEPTADLNTLLNASPLGGTWSGAGVSNPNFNPSTAGIGSHTITYTYGVGTCQTTAISLITVNPQPIISANSETICAGQSASLLGNGAGVGGNYSWSPITALSCTNCQNPSANPPATTIYTVSGTTVEGCSNTANSTITVNPLPIVSAGPDTILCNLPSSVQFTGTQSGGTWTGPNISASGLFTPNGIGTFTITYTVTLGTGCVNSDDRVVQVVDPIPANAGVDQETCFNGPAIQINGIAAGGLWSGTNITITGNFTPSSVGTHPLVYTTGAGNCLTRDTMLFTVHPLPIVSAGPDVEFCSSEAPIDFNGSPAGGIWSGTGITNAANGTFNPTIASVGLHIIVYTYTNPITGCLNRDTLLADVHPLPNVAFNFNPIVCVGTSEVFTNASTLANTNDWAFGDGGTSAVASPSYSYSTIGFYQVELIVTTIFGCQDSLSQAIEVREPPVADFSVLPDSACGPMTVNFTNNSSGISVSYTWNFGNGQTSTLQNPLPQTYAAGVVADTNYTIILNVTNFCGTVTDTETITVMPEPTAIFGTDFSSGCSPFAFTFANSSIGLPDSFYWDFGNGVTSTTSDSLFQQVFTTGTTPTIYTIMLVVSNECGVDTAYHSVTVNPNNVNAFFNTSTTTACNNISVDFTQYTLGGTLWSWDFGDGTTSSAYSPSHTYSSPGIYTVSLFANDGCSFDTTSVTITVNPSPTVDFSYLPDSLCINSPFTFVNESVGAVSSFWDFGDGTTSNLTDPVHEYTAMGNYLVTLTGTSLTNGCTATVTQTVHVNVNPTAQFIAVPISGCVPLNVQFTNQSTNAQYYSWDFGNGNTSAQVNPSQTFTSVGIYSVQLIVENVNGCSDTMVQNITVHPVPNAAFTTSYNCTAPVTIDLTNQSTGAVDYAWNFGNGQTSTLTNPTAVYAVPGTYTISLIVSNQYGCTDQIDQQITVYPPPTLTFVLPVVENCAFDMLSFGASATNVDSVVWNMGDGTTITGNPIDYTYTTVGSYTVSAIGYGGGGCTISYTSPTDIIIHPTAVAAFDYENSQSVDQNDGLVIFTNQSTNATSYVWDFGDGSTVTDVNPSHQFDGFGLYNTTLFASNEFGCNDSVTIEVDVDFFNGLYLPNAIYPGHSNYEVSHFIPKGVGLKEFELLIYDDWGNLIWQTTALDSDGRPTESWDGTFNGEPVQQDAYVWKVTAVFLDESAWEGKEYKNGKFKKAGTVTVIR